MDSAHDDMLASLAQRCGGIEQTLDELAQYPSASDFIRLTRSFLSALRFQDIVSLCYRVIRHE